MDTNGPTSCAAILALSLRSAPAQKIPGSNERKKTLSVAQAMNEKKGSARNQKQAWNFLGNFLELVYEALV